MGKNFIKKLLNILLICFILIGTPAFALSNSESDFNGSNFFMSPFPSVNQTDLTRREPTSKESGWIDTTKKTNTNNTIPPLKLIKLKVKAFNYSRLDRKKQKELKKHPPKEIVTEEVEETEEDVCGNEDSVKAADKRKKETEDSATQQLVVDCQNMNYDPATGILTAIGNVVVTFPEQQTILKADNLVYSKNENNVKATGNVHIIRDGQETLGESIDVDLNRENFFISKPLTRTPTIRVNAEKGFYKKDLITQDKGTLDVTGHYNLNLKSGGGALLDPNMMRLPEEERNYATDGKSKIFNVQAKSIVIDSKENLDVIEIKEGLITTTTGKKVIKFAHMKLYTNKGRDFVEGNYPEIGSRKYLGMFIGPGVVFELPKGSLLKVMPTLNYKSKIGVGGVARFWSGTNQTQFGYGSSYSKFVLKGEQQLDDNLSLIYGSYDYLDNWFLGRQAPKYGADIIYKKAYTKKDFLMKGLSTQFEQRVSAGYFAEPHQDNYYNQLVSDTNMGTTRFRHMAQINQELYRYENEEKMLYSTLNFSLQSSIALYGTGDSQAIGRVGPWWHVQYRHWMQDIGYFQSAYSDGSPIPVYDTYRYGRSNVYLREYMKVHRYLTLAWFGSVAMSNDSPTSKTFQECSFFASVGPDDVKLNVGYDFIRQNAFINFMLALDPKGTTVNYDKMVIKNPDNFNKLKSHNDAIYEAAHEFQEEKPAKNGANTNGALTKAVVEDIEEDRNDI